tara:strand:- start:87 stop:686 length:600 start_codon:yes stop_codon:yes gene_type:complete
MSYLKSKDGSIEASIKEMQKNLKDGDYQKMFKKELDKAGKGIGSMSDIEKKDFFNKIDKKYKGKDEAKVNELTAGQKKLPPALQKAIKDKEDKKESVDGVINQKKHDSYNDPKKGEKKPVVTQEEESFDIEKLKEDVNTLWSSAANDLEEMKKNSKYMKAQDVAPTSDTDSESEKEKGKTLIGSQKTKIVTEPKVDYQK